MTHLDAVRTGERGSFVLEHSDYQSVIHIWKDDGRNLEVSKFQRTIFVVLNIFPKVYILQHLVELIQSKL